MADPLTREAIVDAAEEAVRRFGVDKVAVVDVAKALGVSHGTVYRHFASKAELLDTVTERWLERLSNPLIEIVASSDPADQRLRAWVRALARSKQGMTEADPELFETFRQLTSACRSVTSAHVDHLADQAGRIVADGVARGELAANDPAAAGRAVLHATARFHHPALATEWGNPAQTSADLEAVLALISHGLLPRPAEIAP